MATDQVFEMRIVWSNTDTGENLSIRLHGHGSIGASPNVGTLEDDVVDWWSVNSPGGANPQKNFHGANISLDLVTLRRVVPDEPIEFQNSDGLPIVGTDGNRSQPPQSCVLVSLRTAQIGRSYRGRVYLPPTTIVFETDGGDYIDTVAEEIKANFQGLLDSLAVDDFVPVVLSRQHNEVPVISFPEITAIKVDQRVRTQRRRTNSTPIYS